MKKQLKKLNKKLGKKLEHLKDSLKDQAFYLKSMCRILGKSLLRCLKYCTLAAVVLGASLMSTSLHSAYIENKVGSNTVYIRSPENAALQGSGTGFEIQAPSGKVYTLTNAHVCELAKDNIIMVAEKRFSQRLIPKRVIEVYQDNDLCLIEGLNGYEGLEIASSNDVGDLVWSVGYPMGEAMNISSGRIKSFGYVQISEPELSEKECVGPHRHYKSINLLFFSLSTCIVERYATQTDIPTFPGNSGSPMVNVYGHVEGIIFASSNGTHWGSAVGITFINDLLKPY